MYSLAMCSHTHVKNKQIVKCTSTTVAAKEEHSRANNTNSMISPRWRCFSIHWSSCPFQSNKIQKVSVTCENISVVEFNIPSITTMLTTIALHLHIKELIAYTIPSSAEPPIPPNTTILSPTTAAVCAARGDGATDAASIIDHFNVPESVRYIQSE